MQKTILIIFVITNLTFIPESQARYAKNAKNLLKPISQVLAPIIFWRSTKKIEKRSKCFYDIDGDKVCIKTN